MLVSGMARLKRESSTVHAITPEKGHLLSANTHVLENLPNAPSKQCQCPADTSESGYGVAETCSRSRPFCKKTALMLGRDLLQNDVGGAISNVMKSFTVLTARN